jgi:glycosyltransferase involved in cell wall biosynthesis
LLIILEDLNYGGIARVYSLLAPKLNKYYKIEIITLKNIKEVDWFNDCNINISSILTTSKFRWYNPMQLVFVLIRLFKILNKNKYDVSISSGYFINFINGYFIKRFGIKCILTQHADILDELNSVNSTTSYSLKKMLIRLSFLNADKVVAVSKGIEEVLIETLKIQSKKCITINNPIDIQNIKNKRRDPFTKKIYKDFYSSSKFHFISAGRLTLEKNFNILIDSFKKIYETNNNCTLTILGNGPEKYNLINLIKSYNLQKTILLPGFQSNPFTFFYHSDCFVSSSNREGFGNVIAEAMACGLPIISTNTSGARDVIHSSNKNYGLIVKIQDSNELVDKMKKMMNNKKDVIKYSQLSKERCLVFDVSKIVKKYNFVIKNLILKVEST